MALTSYGSKDEELRKYVLPHSDKSKSVKIIFEYLHRIGVYSGPVS